jgi:hypothetical protein
MRRGAVRQRIRLRHMQSSGPVFVHLHELNGDDELALDGVNTEAAMRLLARLIEPACAAVDDQDAEQLLLLMPAADRDALLAVLHRRCWGDRIVSTMRCKQCSVQFDLSFTLSELQRTLHEQGQQWLEEHFAQQVPPVPPAGRQELDAAESMYADQADQALRVLTGHTEERLALAELLEHAAPIIDLDLDAECAECGHAQQAHFDLQSFVLQRLLNERDLLLHEIHTMACGYHWPMHDILALPRTRRRQFVQLLSGAAI